VMSEVEALRGILVLARLRIFIKLFYEYGCPIRKSEVINNKLNCTKQKKDRPIKEQSFSLVSLEKRLTLDHFMYNALSVYTLEDHQVNPTFQLLCINGDISSNFHIYYSLSNQVGY
jgi:hypothetical protein